MTQKENDKPIAQDEKKSKNGGNGSKHNKILDAAIKIFATYGFHKSKISQIAEEAGVADGTIYLYFKNKDDILISLFEESLSKIIENLEGEIAKETDPIRKLQVFAECHVRMMEEQQNLAEVLTVELRQSHKFMREYTPAKFADYLKVLSLIIREGKDKGVFDQNVHPGLAKRAIYGAIDELALNWLLSPDRKYDLKDAAKHVSDLFLNGILLRK